MEDTWPSPDTACVVQWISRTWSEETPHRLSLPGLQDNKQKLKSIFGRASSLLPSISCSFHSLPALSSVYLAYIGYILHLWQRGGSPWR
jgi:hypothetical protein